MKTASGLVLDTNTILALWHFGDPALDALQRALGTTAQPIFTREDALEELRRVLAYIQFGITAPEQQRLFAAYRTRAHSLTEALDDVPPLPLCRDPDDQKFLEIARDAGASHLLTRDKLLLKLGRHRLVRGRFSILTPERYVAENLT